MTATLKRRTMHHAAPGSEDRLAALNAAITRAGGIVEFARKMAVSPQAVTQWRSQRFVALSRAVVIEDLFGIPREALVSPTVAAALARPRSDTVDLL